METGSLGDVIFETSSENVLTPSSFALSMSGRYQDHEVHGTKQRSEFMGANLGELDLDITVRKAFGPDPLDVFTQLGKYVQQGTVCRLIIAGLNICRCTIRDMSTDWRYLNPGGKGVQVMDIKLKLKEYK